MNKFYTIIISKIPYVSSSVSTGIFSKSGHTVVITQLNFGVSHVPNLIREVTALRCDV